MPRKSCLLVPGSWPIKPRSHGRIPEPATSRLFPKEHDMLFALGLLVLNMVILACVLAVQRAHSRAFHPPPVQPNRGAREKELWF